MARFCTKCGSAVGEGMQFCTNCGATSPFQAAAPAQATPPSSVPKPATAPVAVEPTSPGSSAPAAKPASPVLKVVLLIVAVFAFITVASLGTCVYFGYLAKRRATQMADAARRAAANAGSPEIQMEKGGERSEAVATQEVPPYPGSTPTEGGGNLSVGGVGGISGQEYVTDDPLDKVLAFYKERLGSRITIQQAEGNAMFQLTTNEGITTVTMTRDEGSGKTKINIARIGK
ncbi:MAG TPA: zinc ribbon domain-containing protein [Terriglobia bacterium]|nr:zinc ribbon domain-containing protein [Terriglobia bacterium]